MIVLFTHALIYCFVLVLAHAGTAPRPLLETGASEDERTPEMKKTPAEVMAPVVETTSGLVQGKVVTNRVPGLRTTQEEREWTPVRYLAYVGIPYAQPPVADLRFASPVPVEKWSGVRPAIMEAPVCLQDPSTAPPGRNMSENCLILNVYTPDIKGSRAVMFWIHGGEFKFGDASSYFYLPDYLIGQDIVIVNIQYRLAALGFLNVRIPEAAGNQGLKDQVLALKWVRDNIVNFGGDPNKVSISGQSAGGISVHALMTSPASQGLFNKGLPMSGSMLGYRFFSPEPEKYAYRLGKTLGLHTNSPLELVDLLKSVTAEEIINATNVMGADFLNGYDKFFPFVMSVESEFEGIEAFISKQPIELIAEGNYNKIPLMVGTTESEGIKLLETLNGNMYLLNKIDKQFDIVVPSDLYDRDNHSPEKEALAAKIRHFYFGNLEVSNVTLTIFMQMATESWYNHPVDYWLRLQELVGYESDVYYYQFSYDGGFNFFKLFDKINYAGATHADDLGYVWYMNTTKSLGAGDERSNLVRQRHIQLFGNFIKYGDPTPETNALIPVRWEPTSYPTMQYMDIGADLKMIHQSNKRSATAFWASVYNYTAI